MKVLALALLGGALLTGCGSSGPTDPSSGTITFGLSYKQTSPHHYVIPPPQSAFNAGAQINMVGYLTKGHGDAVHVVVIRHSGDNPMVMRNRDVDFSFALNPNGRQLQMPYNLESMPLGIYEVRFQHGNTILAKGTFSIQ